MIGIRRAAGLAAIAVGLLASNAQAQVKLQFKFPEKSVQKYVETTRIEQTLSINGQDIPTTSNRSIRTLLTAGEKRGDGNTPVQQTIEAVKAQLDLPGGISMSIDSEDQNPPPEGEPEQLRPIRDAIKAIAGISYTILFDQNGKVAGVEGTENALAKADGVDPAIAAELKKQFDATRLKRDLGEAYGIFPDILLREGEPWNRTETMDVGSGQLLTFEKAYEYNGTVDKDGQTLDKITVKAKGVNFTIEPGSVLPLGVEKSDLKVESSDGVILFDRDAGRIVESNLTMHIVGDLILTANGQQLPTKLDLTMESNSKLQKPAQ